MKEEITDIINKKGFYKDLKEMNCWEFKDCDENIRIKCPAYPDKGKKCWKVTGTKCEGGIIEKSTLMEKILYCRNNCNFYKLFAEKY